MKRAHLYLLVFLGILSNFNLSKANPRTKVFVFDMDQVFVDTNRWKTATTVIVKNLRTIPFFMWKMGTDRVFKKKFNGSFSKDNKLKDPAHYNNASYKLSQIARLYKPARKSFDSLMRSIHQTGRYLVKDVIATIKKLKDRGYTVIVATNRDRMGFELTAKKLNFDKLYKGRNLFDAVIVGDAKDFVKETTLNGKRFSKFTPDARYNDYITQASAYKPSIDYYKVIRKVVDNYATKHNILFDNVTPEIVFFDDKEQNVRGANISNLNITAYQVPHTGKGPSVHKNVSRHLGITL